MNIFGLKFTAGCVVLVWAFAFPALGNSNAPAASPEYMVMNTTSASGWATVTMVPLRVECERILRSVKMNVYALGGTGAHSHEPATVSCDERAGHFSVRIDMEADGGVRHGEASPRSMISVQAGNSQESHGPGDGHNDHQHVLYIVHDLE